VYKIDSKNNSIIVAPTKKVHFSGLIAKNMNKFVDFEDDFKAVCRIRKRSEEKPAKIKKISENEYKINFDEPIFAVTPGQFATIYDNNGVVLGCGVIAKYLED
jgi:tRNA-specific 2-thiouridylase